MCCFEWPLGNTLTLLLAASVANSFFYGFNKLSTSTFYKVSKWVKYLNYIKDVCTILCVAFLLYQLNEYMYHVPFSLRETVLGSTFYSLTSLHGIHVLTALFSLYFTQRMALSNLSKSVKGNISLLFSLLLFHWTDIVWLFLFVSLYVLLGGIM